MAYFQHEKALVGPKAVVGEGTRVWAFANVMDGAVVGEHCNICDGCFIEAGAVVGHHVTIKNNVSVYVGVTLEDDVFVGPNATFINDRVPRSHHQGQWTLEKTLVRQGASLGANCTVMCGVTIGEYAVVGAGSVVLKDVPAHAIVVGNPVRQIGWAGHDGQRLNENLQSPSGRQYRLSDRGLEPVEGRLND
ncbi:MAG: N-acetyltransferase [Candidatus Omnitrophica bacterium]|nr:N-acetyltransferase [Candidatus Omnitrophota bacterium]